MVWPSDRPCPDWFTGLCARLFYIRPVQWTNGDFDNVYDNV